MASSRQSISSFEISLVGRLMAIYCWGFRDCQCMRKTGILACLVNRKPSPSLHQVLFVAFTAQGDYPSASSSSAHSSLPLFALPQTDSDASDAFTKGIPHDRIAERRRSTELHLTHPTAPLPPLPPHLHCRRRRHCCRSRPRASPLLSSLPMRSPSPPLPLTLSPAERVAPRGRGYGRLRAAADEEGQVQRPRQR